MGVHIINSHIVHPIRLAFLPGKFEIGCDDVIFIATGAVIGNGDDGGLSNLFDSA